MIFNNKKIIIIGDKDGVSAPAIEACLANSKVDVVLSVTTCFNCSLAGALDEELQLKVDDKLKFYGSENIIVILGGGEAENCSITAESLYSGDVSEIGSVKEYNNGLKVYHAMEKLIVERYNPKVYEEKMRVLEYVLDLDRIKTEMEKIRDRFV